MKTAAREIANHPFELLSEQQRDDIVRTTLRNMKLHELLRYAYIKQVKGATTPLEDALLGLLQEPR